MLMSHRVALSAFSPLSSFSPLAAFLPLAFVTSACLAPVLSAQADTDELTADISAESLDVALQGSADDAGGHVTIDQLTATGVSDQAVEHLTFSGLEGQLKHLDELGSGSVALGSGTLRGFTGLDDDQPELDRLALKDLDVDLDRLTGSLAALDVDTRDENEGRFTLDALTLELDPLIAQAPADQRSPLRMVSNLVTDGSGVLHLDAQANGRQEDDGGATRFTGDSRLRIGDALGWQITTDVTARLHEGADPKALAAGVDGLDDLEGVTLLGGDMDMTLTEQGLFGRLPASLAAMQGMSETDFMEQARTQAEGFGQMYGPGVKQIANGLVAMMAGDAEALSIHLDVPDEANLQQLASDPLALPDRLSMKVEQE